MFRFYSLVVFCVCRSLRPLFGLGFSGLSFDPLICIAWLGVWQPMTAAEVCLRLDIADGKMLSIFPQAAIQQEVALGRMEDTGGNAETACFEMADACKYCPWQ